jgi:hypothetical protein
VPVDYLNVATGLWHRNYTQHRFGYGIIDCFWFVILKLQLYNNKLGVNIGVMNDSMIMFGGLPIDVVGVSSDVVPSMLLSTQWRYDNVQLLNCDQNSNCT